MTFAERLKKAREKLGLRQPQVAKLLEVSARVYWDWEAGRVEPFAITQEGALARLKKKIALSAK